MKCKGKLLNIILLQNSVYITYLYFKQAAVIDANYVYVRFWKTLVLLEMYFKQFYEYISRDSNHAHSNAGHISIPGHLAKIVEMTFRFCFHFSFLI